MSRVEFMKQLNELLTEISPSEREEALQYYNDYFDDAGEENEANVMQELGSPYKVAETIKADLLGRSQEQWEFTEAGCTNMGTHKNPVVPTTDGQNNRNTYQGNYQNGAYNNQYQNQYGNTNGYGTNAAPRRDTGRIILLVLIAIVTSPLWLSVGGTLLGLLFAVFAVLVSLFVAFIAVTFACILSGVLLFGISFAKLFVSPLLGFITMGIGVLLVGIGVLFMGISFWICGTVIPVLFRGTIELCRKPFHRKGGQMA